MFVIDKFLKRFRKYITEMIVPFENSGNKCEFLHFTEYKFGYLHVAKFANAMGLENSGDNLYQTTASYGDAALVDIKAEGIGSITSGILEMSNVDLSQEFTNMITTQRGFQANSRTITVSDTLLEELINLKR